MKPGGGTDGPAPGDAVSMVMYLRQRSTSKGGRPRCLLTAGLNPGRGTIRRTAQSTGKSGGSHGSSGIRTVPDETIKDRLAAELNASLEAFITFLGASAKWGVEWDGS